MMRATMMSGTIAAILHTGYLIFSLGMNGLEAAQIVQTAATTTMGGTVLNWGVSMALFGGALQWIVALASAFVFIVLARIIPALFQFPMSFGALYGIGIYFLMNYAAPMVVDASFSPPPLTGQVSGVLAQALLFGLPMAMTGKMMMSR